MLIYLFYLFTILVHCLINAKRYSFILKYIPMIWRGKCILPYISIEITGVIFSTTRDIYLRHDS